MQVSIETISSTEKKLTISTPAIDVEKRVDEKLRAMLPQIKIAGFRPGKVPFPIAQKRFQDSVRGEVIDKEIKDSLFATLAKENLSPLDSPRVEIISVPPQNALVYNATIELLPPIALTDLSKISLEKPKAEISEEDINQRLEHLRKQHRQWNEITDTQRKVRNGDKIKVDFTTKIYSDTSPSQVKEESEEDIAFEIGGHQMWPEFEAKLLDKAVGDEVAFTLTFPDTHVEKDIAGKKGDFVVKIKQLWEGELLPLDDAFAVKCGVKEGGLQALRAAERQKMEQYLNAQLENYLKRQLAKKLVELHSFEVPKALIAREINRMQEQHKYQLASMGIKDSGQLPQAMLEVAAREQVILGLIFSKIAETNGIKVSPQQVHEEIEKIAQRDSANKDKVLAWFRNNKESELAIENTLLEKAVYDYIEKQVQVVEKPMNYKDAVELAQQRNK